MYVPAVWIAGLSFLSSSASASGTPAWAKKSDTSQVTKRTTITLSVLLHYETYNSIGCFADSSPLHVLPYTPYPPDDTSNTVEKCIDACRTAGYAFAGVECGSECFCGSTFDSTTPMANCNDPCTGNVHEICGGSGAIQVYQNASFVPCYDGYEFIGSFAENNWRYPGTDPRLLPYEQDIPSDDMTVESCIDKCKAGGYEAAGLEYGQECWCGTANPSNWTSASPYDSSMPCTGNPGEACGGGAGEGTINVYVRSSSGKCGNPTSNPSTSTSSDCDSTSTTPSWQTEPTTSSSWTVTTSSTKSTSSTWTSSSSSSKPAQSTTRTVTSSTHTSTSAPWTPASSSSSSKSASSTYSTHSPTSSSTASHTATSSVHTSTTSLEHTSTSTTTMPKPTMTTSPGDESSSTEPCTTTTPSDPYTSSTGEPTHSSSSAVTSSTSEPTTSASSESTEPCETTTTTYIEPTTTWTPSTTAPSSTPSSGSGSGSEGGGGGWSPAGCYEEPFLLLDLLDILHLDIFLTPEACQAGCQNAGYNVCGTSNGNTCYCGYQGLLEDILELVFPGNCNSQCQGNRAQTCGGQGSCSLWYYHH
ncbi:hypothetical protein GYMLUDRAFT_842632 [Collybiopsis luxurians FD-317 M1]|uniref:WSC domain-containing protein n=1 Tax=Collybiopsis luxurians FD-317 M1 TaxID=944289 RepID=A0A0D0BZI5_9AGAR|nr:hypothetical protein GYMLUDRAFT_842632 [Collybiopsis luxurians FD-317 M1]